MKEETRTKSSLRNVSVSLIFQIVTIILNYVCRYVFVKTLSEEYLGVNGLFSNILTVFSLAELGIGSAIVYAMYKPIAENDEEKIKKYMNFYKKCYHVIALIVFILGLILLPNLHIFIEENNIANLNLIYFLYLLDSVFSYLFVYKSSILNAMQKNYICNYYQIIGKIMMTILMSLSLIIFKNFIVYLVIQISFKLLVNIAISIKADKMYPYIRKTKTYNIEKTERKKIFKDVYALFCNQIGNVLINGTDNIIISKYVNLVAVGIYSNYYLVISALSTFIGQMFNAIVASVGNLAATKDEKKTYQLFQKIHFINFIVSAFCVVIASSCINTFIELSFGSKYIMDIYTVIIVLINFYLLAMKNVVGTFKYGLGIFWNDKYCTLIRAIINVIVSIILAKQWGIIGVFIGTLISDLVTTFWYQPYILFKRGFNLPVVKYFKDFAIYTVITTIMIGISLLVLNYIQIESLILKLAIEVVVSFTIFLAIVIILFRKSEGYIYIKEIIMNYINKIKGKLVKEK